MPYEQLPLTMWERVGERVLQNKNIKFAKLLRINQTDAELRVWQALRASRLLGFKFRRQVPIADFIVDFVCFEQRLIIEIDGGQHFDSKSDLDRDAKLISLGFQVLRFWNNEVMQNFDGVLAVIVTKLQKKSLSPTLSHMGRGGNS